MDKLAEKKNMNRSVFNLYLLKIICAISLLSASNIEILGKTYSIKGEIFNKTTLKYVSDSLSLYQNEALIKRLYSDGKKGFKINNLFPGEYLIRYENQFLQKFDTLITIKERSHNRLIVRVTHFEDDSFPTFLERMENGDSLEYVKESIGCEMGLDRFLIVKESGRLYVTLNSSEKKLLTESQFQELRLFEKQFRRWYYVHTFMNRSCSYRGISTYVYQVIKNGEVAELNFCNSYGSWVLFSEIMNKF